MYSFRLDDELMTTFDAVGIEIGKMNRSDNMRSVLQYMLKPHSIAGLKAILQNG